MLWRSCQRERYTLALRIRQSMGYSLLMRVGTLSIAALVSITMLAMQMTGLHLHASQTSDNASLHGVHVHDVDSDGHDHSADVDVSLSDLGMVWSKIMSGLLVDFSIVLAIVSAIHSLRPPPAPILFQQRRLRWRPLLRAPPLVS